MFIKNNMNKDVSLSSFEGYEFVIPTGVVAIWDKAGEHLIQHYLPVGEHGKYTFEGGEKVFKVQKPPTPVITESTQKEWDKGGRKFVEVKRFQMRNDMIPKDDLIKIAFQRGIPGEKLNEYQFDKNLGPDAIVRDINELPVPEEIKYPIKNLQELNETSE